MVVGVVNIAGVTLPINSEKPRSDALTLHGLGTLAVQAVAKLIFILFDAFGCAKCFNVVLVLLLKYF